MTEINTDSNIKNDAKNKLVVDKNETQNKDNLKAMKSSSHSSPAVPLGSHKSESKGSVDSDKKSTKSDSSEWRINKYLPRGFRREGKGEKRSHSIFRLIRMDCRVLNSCTAYSQIIILVTSLVIIFMIVMSGCFKAEDKNQVKGPIFRAQNQTTETTTYQSKKFESSAIKCGAQYHFLIICIIAANVEIFTLMFYLFHFVEALPKIPWLAIESIFYSFCALQYFVLSIWMAFYGDWFLMMTFIGIVDSFLFIILASIKYRKYKSGKPAQERSDDPDGNVFRKLSPNLKFTKSLQDHNKSMAKRSESLGSL